MELITYQYDPQASPPVGSAGGRNYTGEMPANYTLMILDDGVPSVGKWVKVEGGGNYTISSGTVRWGADVWLDRDYRGWRGE